MNFSNFLKTPQKPNSAGRGPEPSWFVKIFASGLYSGYFPVASGTAGSFVALLLYYFIPQFSDSHLLLLAMVVTFVLGIPASEMMEKYYGHDPSEVTIDEVVGMWITLFFLPKNILIVGSAFLIFRVFDILKPYPANRFDTMHGGFGIMMDDVVSGVYSNLVLQVLFYTHFFSFLGNIG
jgi:phosphatidylglycerophosphatase A